MKVKIWLIAIIVVTLILSAWTIRNNIVERFNDYKQVIEKKDNQIAYHKGENGQLIASQNVLSLTNKELKAIADDLIKDNDGLKKQVGNLKNINSYLKGKLESQVSDTIILTDTLLIGDTLPSKKFGYDNGFLILNGIIHKNTLDFTYKYSTDFTYVTFWKRPGFLKQKELVMDFSIGDPNAILTSAQTIYIKPEPKKFYEKNWFWGLAAFSIGLIATK